jgi:hypothetical protein
VGYGGHSHWHNRSARTSSPVSHARLGHGLPLLVAWPGGLPCPWTEGTVDTVACTRPPGASGRANEVGPEGNSSPAVASSGAGWLGGVLAAGGRACQEPSGQIPPPWAWWENEAPTARVACSSLQASDWRMPTLYLTIWSCFVSSARSFLIRAFT